MQTARTWRIKLGLSYFLARTDFGTVFRPSTATTGTALPKSRVS